MVSPFPWRREDPHDLVSGTPAPDPDTPPDSNDPSGPCPRCGRVSSFDVSPSLPTRYTDMVTAGPHGQEKRDFDERAVVLHCRGCGDGTVVVENRWVGGHLAEGRNLGSGGILHFRGKHWWPPADAKLDASVPPQLADAYGESLRCLAAGSPRAAVVMFRRALEAIVHERGSEQPRTKPNLAEALRQMADDRDLESSLAEWATELRTAGNLGAHFDPLRPVSAEDAQDLARLHRDLLRYLYEVPAQIARRRAARSA